jgi:hypothetical protein
VVAVSLHSSVLYQVTPGGRDQFAATVRALGARWLSSEAPGIIRGTDLPSADDQMCVLALDGLPVARADSHGAWLSWLPSAARGAAPGAGE